FTYSQALWPEVKASAERQGFKALDPLVINSSELQASIQRLKMLRPKVVHIQHEFGLFGKKIPPFYKFPKWVKKLKKEIPDSRIVATAHTVIDSNFKYPWQGRGWQSPFLFLANYTLVPVSLPLWTEATWKNLDGIIVHSRYQAPT